MCGRGGVPQGKEQGFDVCECHASQTEFWSGCLFLVGVCVCLDIDTLDVGKEGRGEVERRKGSSGGSGGSDGGGGSSHVKMVRGESSVDVHVCMHVGMCVNNLAWARRIA